MRYCNGHYEVLKPRAFSLCSQQHIYSCHEVTFCFLAWITKDSSALLFRRCQHLSQEPPAHNCRGWPPPPFFCFICYNCFAISGCQNRTRHAYCVMRLLRRMALPSEYASRCGTDGQNMFLDRGHKFPGLPVAACCALSPHLEHDLTKGEKNGEGGSVVVGALGKTRRSSTEQTDSISPRLCTQLQTGKRSGEGVSNLFPELWQSITRACCSDWTLHWMDVLRFCFVYFTPPWEPGDINL